jgi:hypothetical protein
MLIDLIVRRRLRRPECFDYCIPNARFKGGKSEMAAPAMCLYLPLDLNVGVAIHADALRAERFASLILSAELVFDVRKPATLVAKGVSVGGAAWSSGFAKSRRRPKAWGHSRSHPLRRPRHEDCHYHWFMAMT